MMFIKCIKEFASFPKAWYNTNMSDKTLRGMETHTEFHRCRTCKAPVNNLNMLAAHNMAWLNLKWANQGAEKPAYFCKMACVFYAPKV